MSDIDIDLPTVLLLHMTSLLAGAIGLLNLRRRTSKSRGLVPLVAAFLALACEAALAGFGEYAVVPQWLWTHLSLLLGTAGYAMFWMGMRGLSGRRRTSLGWTALAPAGWFVLGLVTQFPSDNSLRASAFHLTAVVFLSVSAFEIWRDRRSEPLPSRGPLVLCMATSAAVYAVRFVCIVGHVTTSFDMATAFFLQILCNFTIALFVVALVKERAEVDLQCTAETDMLTGMGNRRWFISRLPSKVLGGSAIAILDLDRFKQINDRFGHAAGDRALMESAKLIKSQLRERDLFARFGGEEFALFLPTIPPAKAVEIAERLRRRLEEFVVDIDGVQFQVTVSIGIAWVDGNHGTWNDWMQAADGACYVAKRRGRNCVVQHVGSVPSVPGHPPHRAGA